MSTITLSDVHEFAVSATAPMLRLALRDKSGRSAPADLALRALSCAFNCDTRGAIALLRRALKAPFATREDRSYIRDLLVTHLMNIAAYDDFENVLADDTSVPLRLKPLRLASEAMLHAVRGRPARSRLLARKAATSARNVDDPLILGRVLTRCSMAAFYRCNYDEVMELSLESANVYEEYGCYAGAAASNSLAGIVAVDWNRDATMAAGFYDRMVTNAERAGHQAILRSSLAGSFSIAAERFDAAACKSLRERLRFRPAAEQHQENYPYIVAEILGFGWNADFGAADATLVAGAATAKSRQQLALLEALRSLIDAARWDIEAARRRSRSVLHLTAEVAEHEPLFDRRYRETARILAAATCFVIGDQVRGERALSANFDPGHRYLSLLTARSIDTTQFPDVFRGYAEFARVASVSAYAARPRNGLTPAEMQVLRALPSGVTLAEIARELAKSKNTVARQVESIYEKLSARNRAHAVENARQLGILT
jgi:DNA-binding CsgD family transcriptional regulator